MLLDLIVCNIISHTTIIDSFHDRVHNRLMNCSDIHLAHVCSKCGGMISVYAHSGDYATAGFSSTAQSQQKCSTCKSAANVQPVHLPYVFRYLANELAGMGIKLSLKLSD